MFLQLSLIKPPAPDKKGANLPYLKENTCIYISVAYNGFHRERGKATADPITERESIMHAATNLASLLNKGKSELFEGADHECYRVFFEGQKGNVELCLDPAFETLSLQGGDLSTNEVSLLKGYCRQEGYYAEL